MCDKCKVRCFQDFSKEHASTDVKKPSYTEGFYKQRAAQAICDKLGKVEELIRLGVSAFAIQEPDDSVTLQIRTPNSSFGFVSAELSEKVLSDFMWIIGTVEQKAEKRMAAVREKVIAQLTQ